VLASTQRHQTSADMGRRAAAEYFFQYELPKIDAWLQVVSTRNMTCANLPEEAF
jgi:butyryl-CoA dehydrogenase